MIDHETVMLFIYQVLGPPMLWAAAFVAIFFTVVMLIVYFIDLLDP